MIWSDTYLSKIEKYNELVVIVGNEMHAQSIVPWRSRNEKKFNSTIEIITYIASSTTVDINKKMSCNYLYSPTYTKKALKYIASCTPLHPFLEHNVDLLLKNIHLYLLNNLWIAKKALHLYFKYMPLFMRPGKQYI